MAHRYSLSRSWSLALTSLPVRWDERNAGCASNERILRALCATGVRIVTGLPVNIRRAHESEAADLSALARASKAYWSYSAAELSAWHQELSVLPDTVSSLPTYVAEIDSKLAGFFMLHPGSPCWQLEHFWVSPAWMGRGVGRALLSKAVLLAAEAGAAAIEIDADPHAEPFYSRCGATRAGSLAAPIEGAPARERPRMLLTIG